MADINHFLQLGIAYETLSDGIRRRKYDATLILSQKTNQSPQPAWPPQTSSNPWRATTQSRTWGWSRDAREKADQARREDDEYWSGPTYYHSAYEHNAWGDQWGPEQEHRYSSKHQERQHKARKEARREARRKKRDMNTPSPPPGDPVDKDAVESKAKTAKYNEEQETCEKAQEDERCDDGSWTKSPSPQQPDPTWSERVKEKKERKEQSAWKKAERELSRRNWPAELLLLFSKITNLQVDIEETLVKANESRGMMKVRVPQSVSCLIKESI